MSRAKKLATTDSEDFPIEVPSFRLIRMTASNKKMNLADQVEAVRDDPTVIKFIKSPSKKVQLAAVMQELHVIQFIENLCEEAIVAAIKEDESLYGALAKKFEMTDDIHNELIDYDPWLIRQIDKPSRELQIKAVKKNTTGYCCN